MELLFCLYRHLSYTTLLSLSLLLISKGGSGATFTFVNKCDFTVWPGILSGAGSPKLESTGFTLTKGSSRTFQAPTGWSGRFWGRTDCNFDDSGSGSCATGDCSSGTLECNGATSTPPTTLAEITLGSGSQDFYDVSLVDGYNLPIILEGSGGSGTCGSTGCITNLNRRCPAELRTDGGGGCKSACEAFGTPEYCCVGAYSTALTCKPSQYSQIFKSACPKSYSYAYDDATSTFTCTGADYTITFCPSSSSSKSSRDSSPETAGTTIDGSGSEPGSDSALEQAELATSWLANLATGDSSKTHPPLAFSSICLIMAISLLLSSLCL